MHFCRWILYIQSQVRWLCCRHRILSLWTNLFRPYWEGGAAGKMQQAIFLWKYNICLKGYNNHARKINIHWSFQFVKVIGPLPSYYHLSLSYLSSYPPQANLSSPGWGMAYTWQYQSQAIHFLLPLIYQAATPELPLPPNCSLKMSCG